MFKETFVIVAVASVIMFIMFAIPKLAVNKYKVVEVVSVDEKVKSTANSINLEEYKIPSRANNIKPPKHEYERRSFTY